jgi:hypothetical protein
MVPSAPLAGPRASLLILLTDPLLVENLIRRKSQIPQVSPGQRIVPSLIIVSVAGILLRDPGLYQRMTNPKIHLILLSGTVTRIKRINRPDRPHHLKIIERDLSGKRKNRPVR